MKKMFLAFMLVTAGASVMAQPVERAKDYLQRKKLPEAKVQIDKVVTNPKWADDPDVLYTKAKIYVAIADDSVVKATVPDAREQAFDALKSYVIADVKNNPKKEKQLIYLQFDQYRPAFDIYYGFYKAGAAFYNSNNFRDAFTNFKKCLEVSDYIRANNWKDAPTPSYTSSIDTSVVLYTGVAAEKIDRKDSAAFFYSQLADKKIKTKDMIELYKWLVEYYYEKPDSVNTLKYLALGKELYPEDSYWSGKELEIATKSNDKAAIYKKYEEMMVKEPGNYAYPYNYGVELYKDVADADADKRPANSDEIIAKAETMIRKSLEVKPDFLQSNLVLGQILYNQAAELSIKLRNFKAGIPNANLTADEVKHRETLKADMMKKFDEAIPYLEKVGDALGGLGKLKKEDKNALKNAYDLLSTIYGQKGNKPKMEEFQEKYNQIEKVH